MLRSACGSCFNSSAASACSAAPPAAASPTPRTSAASSPAPPSSSPSSSAAHPPSANPPPIASTSGEPRGDLFQGFDCANLSDKLAVKNSGGSYRPPAGDQAVGASVAIHLPASRPSRPDAIA